MVNTSSATPNPTPHAESAWLSKSAAQTRGSDKKEVQFHYDISNDFFKL
ncbi:MAG: cyclopropane-fatty-acyl-phospholipid synthase, partial [Mycobacterium sp.]|nr:cyclopropane-fatty-acyl-phospholipid synthase [Mycobacterium sp.]